MDTFEKKAFSIFKQPAYRLLDMLNKKCNDINITAVEIRFFLDDIKTFFSSVCNSQYSIFLAIDYENEGDPYKNILNKRTAEDLITLSTQNNYIHFIDIKCNLVKSVLINTLDLDNIIFDVTNISVDCIPALAELLDTTFIHGINNLYEIYHEGKCIQPFSGERIGYIPGKVTLFNKPMEQYKDLINDHYNKCVRYSQATDHWSKKSERILRAAPEDIFKKSLWFYLFYFADNVIDVVPEYVLPSENKIDIFVRTKENKVYIFEVKVLGKYYSNNENGYNEYKEERVHHGMYQCKLYIEEIGEIERASLLIYDARKNPQNIEIGESEQHIKLDKPYFFYLESDNVTTKVGKKLSEIKKQ